MATTVEQFFAEEKQPDDLATVEGLLKGFVSANGSKGRPVVCVTCGGTTVPLEANTVRFIDNFSTGRRGAVSTEYFLAQGYSVVFLQRKGCISPFARRIQEALESKHLDTKLLSKCGLPDTANNKTCNWSNPQIDLSLDLGANADPSRKKNVVDAIQKYHAAADAGHLLCVEFESVVEYLFYLKHVSLAFQPLGRRAMIYLAAAVSDFYIPRPSMAQHKIQSREGPLCLELAQVPKMLGSVNNTWAPEAYCVSFKLETDEDILIKKATGAIDKYRISLVVANELHSRNSLVRLVSKKDKYSPVEVKDVRKEGDADIEEALVMNVALAHFGHIGTCNNRLPPATKEGEGGIAGIGVFRKMTPSGCPFPLFAFLGVNAALMLARQF